MSFLLDWFYNFLEFFGFDVNKKGKILFLGLAAGNLKHFIIIQLVIKNS